MLKSLDILIGLAVIMLVLSMVVTVLTQAVTGMLNSRGRHLKKGLADLLKQIDPSLDDIAERVADRILTHPLVRSNNFFGVSRAGSVIQREEFTSLLMELAAGQGPHKWTDAEAVKTFQERLANALKSNGLSDPGKTLENVRMLALNLEAARPELANYARRSIALLQEARGPLVAKVNDWFDQTMDRTSQRFTFTARGITFACALVVAFGLQVDTVGLVNRLSMDERLRADLGDLATRVVETQRSEHALEAVVTSPAFAAMTPGERRESVRARSREAGSLSDTALDQAIIRRAMQQLIASDAFRDAPREKQRTMAMAIMPGLDKLEPLQQDLRIAEITAFDVPQSQREYLEFLAEKGLVVFPSADWGRWWATLSNKNLLGILVSVFLLSLGAPFWYDVLKRLINLRSVLARKEDQQREERQFAKPPSTPATTTTASAPALVGERGDLTALG